MTDLTTVAAQLHDATETVRQFRAAQRAVRPVLDGSIGRLDGYTIHLDEWLPDGTVRVHKHRWLIVIGTRPLTPVQLAGHEARYIVRSGLADVVEWLGWDVGPERPPTHEQILDVLGLRAGGAA